MWVGKPRDVFTSNDNAKRAVKLKPTYRIVNIVVKANLATDLDLYLLGKLSFDIDYEPEQFPGAIFRVHDPKSTILIFKNGKIICTGTKRMADVKRSVQNAVDLVNKYLAQNPRAAK